MEGNPLSSKQIKNLLKGIKVNASQHEIQEVKNTAKLCQHLKSLNPFSVRDFKYAHYLLCNRIVETNGHWRTVSVVVQEGNQIVHVPPNPRDISKCMSEYFHFIKSNPTLPWLIKACVFHYGVQFVHPFEDANGRMGRIWQHLLLLKENPIFNTILIGKVIRAHQWEYYDSLDKCDRKKQIAPFIEFCLKRIKHQLNLIGKS